MDHAISTRDLTRAFGGHVAVDRVTLTVPWGRVYGYLGLNGAGKSTTIRMLATLLAPSAGSARVAGHDVVEEPLAVRAAIGLVGDEGAASRASWTAEEYLLYFARARGLRDARAEVDAALDLVDLARPWRRRVVAAYSTGMRRRVEIARALLGAPRVLFLDEPTRGLDLPAKHETWALLRHLVARGDRTVFLSSHDAAEVQALCGDLAVVAGGRLGYEGPAAALGRDPAAFEAALVRLLRGAPREATAEAPRP